MKKEETERKNDLSGSDWMNIQRMRANIYKEIEEMGADDAETQTQ